MTLSDITITVISTVLRCDSYVLFLDCQTVIASFLDFQELDEPRSIYVVQSFTSGSCGKITGLWFHVEGLSGDAMQY